MAIKSFDQLSVEFDENEVETDDLDNQIDNPLQGKIFKLKTGMSNIKVRTHFPVIRI